jgi:multidrug efflux pump subunit AcrB
MSGVAGAYFKVLTDTMIITLICSFVTWILLPVVYLLLTKKRKYSSEVKLAKEQHEVKSQNWVAFIENRY